MKKINLCTLFDSNYIDRGIALYESLVEVESDFILYVIAFDDICEKVLRESNYNNMVVISYSEFEDDILCNAKTNRSLREYMWTCSGYSIRYVMDKYNLDECTYIDSDLYFYSTPKLLLDDFEKSGCDVAIIAHNYSNHYENRYYERACGKYCVEFNTFKNTTNGRNVLDWWIESCIRCCTEKRDGQHFGDQKYLDEFKTRFTGIYEYNRVGAGVAPWNVDAYKVCDKDSCIIRDFKQDKLIFYHFHSFKLIGTTSANCSVFVRPGKHDKKLVYSLYNPYAKKLVNIRTRLCPKYNIFLGEDKSVNKYKILWDFLTEDPNILMLFRKIIRYIFYRKNDYIRIEQ